MSTACRAVFVVCLHLLKEIPLSRFMTVMLLATFMAGCTQKPIEAPKDTKVPTAGLVEGGERPGAGAGGPGTQQKNPK